MIRLKVFLPVLGIFALITWVLMYQIDAWMKSAIESSLSGISGTKAEISRLHLSFKDSRLEIDHLKVGSPSREFKNIVELDSIVFDFQFLPLLEKRVVLDDFSIKGIAWNTPREKSGWLPKKAIHKKEAPSWMDEWIAKGTEELKQEFQSLPVARLADFRVPSNVQEVLLTFNLESEEKFKELASSIQDRQREWIDRYKDLKDISEYKRVISETRQLTDGLPNNPKQILARVQTAKKAVDFFQAEERRVKKLLEEVDGEIKSVRSDFQSAVDVVQKDYRRALDTVSLDQLKMDNLSRIIFGKQWISRVEAALKYQAHIRNMLAKVAEEEGQQVQVRERAMGRDIIFIEKKEKPGFILEKSSFSVTGLEKEQAELVSQRYELELKGINSAPRLYGKPSSVEVSGKFKEALIGGVDLSFLWDYTETPVKDRYKAFVKNIQAKSWPMGIPKIFPLKIQSGVASAESELQYIGEDFKWVTRANFRGVRWDFQEVPRIGFLIPALVDVFEEIRNFYLEFELRNKQDGLAYIVRSDLDQRLKKSVSRVIDKKWAEFKEKLRTAINKEVARYRREAEKQKDEFEKKVRGQIEDRLKLLRKYEREAKAKINELQKEAKNKVKNKAVEQLKGVQDQLPSGIKNPF